MLPIHQSDLPERALLGRYATPGTYTDCYYSEVPNQVDHADFVRCFYTTWLFRLERLILKWAVSRPSTDADATAVAAGDADSFAAWTVEDRRENQLLMCDFQGRTRSWFMTVPREDGGSTRLYFGSAVVPLHRDDSGKTSMGAGFHALIGFHKLYSVALLYLAKSRLKKI